MRTRESWARQAAGDQKGCTDHQNHQGAESCPGPSPFPPHPLGRTREGGQDPPGHRKRPRGGKCPELGILPQAEGSASLSRRAGPRQPVDKPRSALIWGQACWREEGSGLLWTPVKKTSVRQVKWKFVEFAGVVLGQNIIGS